MATKKKPAIKKFNLVKVLKDFEDGTFTLEETAEKIEKHYAIHGKVYKLRPIDLILKKLGMPH
jgi:hypothetical protein